MSAFFINQRVLCGEYKSETAPILLLSDLSPAGQTALLSRTNNLKADLVITGLPTEGEPLSDALIDAIQPKVIVVVDSEYPVQQRASRALMERLGRSGISFQTNLMSALDAQRPYFDFYLNDSLITNNSIVSIKNTRHLKFTIINRSSITADKLEVNLTTPPAIGPTDLIYNDSWSPMPSGISVVNNILTPNSISYHWLWVADKSLAGGSFYDVNPLNISTNVTIQAVVVEIEISAVYSKKQSYSVTLTF